MHLDLIFFSYISCQISELSDFSGRKSFKPVRLNEPNFLLSLMNIFKTNWLKCTQAFLNLIDPLSLKFVVFFDARCNTECSQRKSKNTPWHYNFQKKLFKCRQCKTYNGGFLDFLFGFWLFYFKQRILYDFLFNAIISGNYSLIVFFKTFLTLSFNIFRSIWLHIIFIVA